MRLSKGTPDASALVMGIMWPRPNISGGLGGWRQARDSVGTRAGSGVKEVGLEKEA
jgi:hypothetical protein